MRWGTSDERPGVGLRHGVRETHQSLVGALDLDAEGQAGTSLQAHVRALEERGL